MEKKIKVKDLIDPEELKKHLPELSKYFENGGTWQLLMGISSAELELHYAQAYEAYASGEYETSAAIFITLSMMNPYEIKYWFGLGATKQMVQEYEAAIQAYTLASLLDETAPTAYFHIGQCYYALQQRDKCLEFLEKAHEMASGQELYKAMNSEIERLMRAINAKR